MNPHVARFEDVEVKDLLVIEDAEKLLLIVQRREGENRIGMAALISTD